MIELLTSSRRAFLAWAGSGAALMLAGCGGTSIVDRLNAQRFLIVGDGFHDQGQTGSRPTVNGDGTPTWLQQMASYYSKCAPVLPAVQGGTAWAQTYAFINSADTVSGTSAPSVQAQINKMLAATTIAKDDLVFINGGMADIMQAIKQTGISDATTTAVNNAGSALANLVLQLTQNGAQHVVVTSVYDLSISPWALATGLDNGKTGENTPISKLAIGFNNQVKTILQDHNLGATVLYVDAAQFYNFIYNSPVNYGMSNITTPVCTTPTALSCNTSTVVNNAYNTYMFADDRHFTPTVNLMFSSSSYGNNCYSSLINRW